MNVKGLSRSSLPQAGRRRFVLWPLLVWLGLAGALPARAELQFDVFIGYDGIVREANWFPVVCEVFNDGPPFVGTIEFSASRFNAGQMRRLVAELPTGTRKRFVIPAYAAGRNNVWDARLLDPRGKVLRESPMMRPRRDTFSRNYLLGAVPRSLGGLPVLPGPRPNSPDTQAMVCHLRAELFPDHPIALEGLDAIYLNTERALDLKANQVRALLDWLYAGGHLIVGVEQPGDLNGLPWLREVMPCELTAVTTHAMNGELQTWLTAGRGVAAAEAPASPAPSPLYRPAPSPRWRPPDGPTRGPPVPTPASPAPVSPAPPPGSPTNRFRGMSPQMIQRYGLVPPPGGVNVVSAPVDPFTRLGSDSIFDQATLPLATGTVQDGRVVFSLAGDPLWIDVVRGRGQVTVLTFSPEREPFRSWRNRPWFWAKLCQVPSELLNAAPFMSPAGVSIDGVFGSMIDSKQVRKLPVSWLLLLLVVYLAVIGPVDQYCLKKLNKQMLTWLTFPVYVVLFSGLIYLIGYKLRAGETEYNELHLVDILPNGNAAELRGRTYASIYSPANARFRLAGEQQFATLRSEALASWGGGAENSHAEVEHRGDGYRAEVFVPVWTSQLFVNDWWQSSTLPLSATVTSQGAGYQLTVKNLLKRPLTHARLVLNHRVHALGDLEPHQTKTFNLPRDQGGMALRDFVLQNANQFTVAAQERRQVFGRDPAARTWDLPSSTMAASFLSAMDPPLSQRPVYGGGFGGYNTTLLAPAGFDLSFLLERGQAILLAWDDQDSLTTPIRQFTPRRSRRDTLLRLAIPLNATPER